MEEKASKYSSKTPQRNPDNMTVAGDEIISICLLYVTGNYLPAKGVLFLGGQRCKRFIQ
jgi:hypothetical protein